MFKEGNVNKQKTQWKMKKWLVFTNCYVTRMLMCKTIIGLCTIFKLDTLIGTHELYKHNIEKL